MKKNAIIYLIPFFTISCNFISKKQDKEIDTSSTVKMEIIDTGSIIDAKNLGNKDSSDFSIVLSRMNNQKELIDADYNTIIDFLLTNNNESNSEEVGYAIFEYLKKNKYGNVGFALQLNKKEKSLKDTLLSRLVQIMCIDLGEEDYTYEVFINDFELFKNSASAKKAFKDCMRNQVE